MAERHRNDYYVTPIKPILDFLSAWDRDTGIVTRLVETKAWTLDPCAGGDAVEEMPYPAALIIAEFEQIATMDIRPDSRAVIIDDYLRAEVPKDTFGLIVSNPPFSQATEFIRKALEDVVDGGYVVMLLRLNYFGAQKRASWFQSHMPTWSYVHSKRIGFIPGKPSKTDSIEYMHAVWVKGSYPLFVKQRVLMPGD